MSYQAKDGIKVPPVLRRVAVTLTITLVLSFVVFIADTVLHYTTSTIQFNQVSISHSRLAYGRGLSVDCLNFNRADNFGLPCSRNGVIAATDRTAYFQGQNEIFYLRHDMSNKSQIQLIEHRDKLVQERVAILTPQSSTLSPFRDYRAETVGVHTSCAPITTQCSWTDGPQETYSQFNCSRNWWGVLGKFPNVSDSGEAIEDEDVPPLAFKPGSALQYAYFVDLGLDTPYDAAGYLTNEVSIPDADLINPVYFAVAGRFAQTSQRAGANMTLDPEIHQGLTTNLDVILKCQYATYAVDYTWINSTARIRSMTRSLNGTMAEIFHGYNPPGSFNAFDNDMQDLLLQAALQENTNELARSFADNYSTRILSVIGPFMSSRENVQEQTRTPSLVAVVSKAPLACLVACCLGYVTFGIMASISAYRALRKSDVRDLAFKLGLPALAMNAFKDPKTDLDAVKVGTDGHRVFEETKIRDERVRVTASGSPLSGFMLRSLV